MDAAAASKAVTAEQGSKFVLLIEDDDIDARVVVRLLSERSHYGVARSAFEVTHVRHLSQGFDRLEETPFDVVLLDLGLPDSHGLESLVKLLEAYRDLPVIVLTGHEDHAAGVRAVSQGAQDYILKDQLSPDLLVRAMQYAMERKENERRLARLAHYDHLTGLANRVLFEDHLRRALARAGRSGSWVGVLFIDLDRFKRVNDTLGHEAGDELLRQVGRRMHSCLREGDVVARLGGDEFAVVLDGMRSPSDVAVVADKICAVVRPPFELADHQAEVGCSIGIAVFPDAGLDVRALMKNADAAMYRAKASGRGGHYVYDAGTTAAGRSRMRMERDLREAVGRQEFHLHYQPMLTTRGNHVTGVEALLRWPRIDGSCPVPPATFIPVLEETGLIHRVGGWLFRALAQQWREWQAAGIPALRLAMNLSTLQLTNRDTVETMLFLIDQGCFGGARLVIELSEICLAKNAQASAGPLEAFVNRGVSIAIDDFGAGPASLSLLTRFPYDTIKIDRTLVRDAGADRRARVIVSAIVRMAKDLGVRVIAEGVETPQQLTFLRREGCEEVQGHLYSGALPGAACRDFIMRQGVETPGATACPALSP